MRFRQRFSRKRVRGELRGFYSTDVVQDLESFRPDDGESFGLLVTAFVGPNDRGGEEMFDFFVCTAQWLAEHPPEKGFWFLRNYLLLTRWDYGVLDRALRDLCARAEGETWEEVATKLSRYGRWEFDTGSSSGAGRLAGGRRRARSLREPPIREATHSVTAST